MQLVCTYPQANRAACRDAQSLAPESAALPPTPLSDDWLRGQGCGFSPQGWGNGMQGWEVPASCLELAAPYFMDSSGESSPGMYVGTATAAATSIGTSGGAAPTPFASLSSYLADRWTTAEHGLDYVDAQCKRWPEGLLCGEPPQFIHPRHWESKHKHRYLLPVASIVQLYAMGTPDSKDVLVSAIDSQLHQMQVNVQFAFPLPLGSI